MAVSGEDLDFKISKEDWNIYELADGTILKVRSVLRRVIRTKAFNPDGEPAYAFGSQNFLAPRRTPKKLMGTPTIPPPTEEQVRLSGKVEVGFRIKTEEWNEYNVEDGAKFRTKLVVTKVERTKFFGELGYPVYGVSSKMVTSVSVPKSLRKRPPRGKRKKK